MVESDEADLYAAMDCELERQGAIQKKLAAVHDRPRAACVGDHLSPSSPSKQCVSAGEDRRQPRRQAQCPAGELMTF